MTAPEVGSRWRTPGGKAFTVKCVGDRLVFVKYDDGSEGTLSLAWFADGTLTPEPPPLPTPPEDAWFTVTDDGYRIWYPAREGAVGCARYYGRPAVARYVLDRVEAVS